MPLSVGDRVPETTFYVLSDTGPRELASREVFAGRKVVVVGMPGAFTPTCHRNHLPGFLENSDAIRERGVDEIIILTTNDAYVIAVWAEATGALGRVRFVSDGNAEFIRKAGLDMDRSQRGMGLRSKRFAMIVDDWTVTALSVEDTPGETVASSAAQILAQL